MKFAMPNAQIFIPDGVEENAALERTTHMAISAHQDDIEIMAYDGVFQCYDKAENWFTGVVVSDGRGSPRSGAYANYTDEQMWQVRREEQKKAAQIGKYGAQLLLDYSSRDVKNPSDSQIKDELKRIIETARPKVIYTHNLADKHDTHVGVVIKTIEALRELPNELQPEKLYGCEVWRGLDWIDDADKVKLDVSGKPELEAALLAVFDSQIVGGKRYDLATVGRRLANATYAESHGTDESNSLCYAMDLTMLIVDKALDINEFIQQKIKRLADDVGGRINRLVK